MKSRQPHAMDELCWEWVRWCVTRKFYIRPPGKSILARLQPSKSGKEPNGRNHPDLQFFNMAVHALGDMPKHKAGFAVFHAHYMGEGDVVKRAADKLGISRPTYYARLAQFAKDAYSMSQSLKRIHDNKTSEAALAATKVRTSEDEWVD
jgi:hypothetical protein